MSQGLFAYKYVIIAAMMNQINHYAPRMHLPIQTPVKEADIRFLHVSPPFASARYQDYGGRFQVTNYSFTFGPNWHNIYNMDEHGFISLGVSVARDESSHSALERASRMKYMVNTNDVYRMASNWLAALDIDQEKLEASSPPCINRSPLFKSDRGWVPTPLMTVEWISPKRPGWNPTGTYVEVSAVTGELLKLVDGNGTFSKRKALINDLDKLLSISDEEFLKYTEQDRRELVKKYAGVTDNRDFMTNIPPVFYEKLFRQKEATTQMPPKRK